MKLKIALATATAMGLVLGSAQSGSNNTSNVIQVGDGNSALVEQDGSSNAAGSTTYTDFAIKQGGDNNSIDIQQNGTGNRIGTGNALSDSAGSSMALPPSLAARRPSDALRNFGVDQVGDHNDFVLRQTETSYPYGNGNAVITVKQQASANATETANRLSITQSNLAGYSVQFVGDVYQNNTSAGADEDQKNDMTITQTGGGYQLGNRAFILTQNGFDNTMSLSQTGTNNIVSRASQIGNGHEATLSQFGSENWIARLDQQGSDQFANVTQTGAGNIVSQVDQSGSDNSTTLSIDGNGNGVAALFNGAGYVSTPDNGVTQMGTDNQIVMTITDASNNSFGFFQDGAGNKAIGIDITGDDNQLGVRQVGTDNDFSLSSITGSGNNIGLDQFGTENFSTINISGSFNGGGSFGAGPADAVANGRPSGLIVQHGSSLGTGFNEVSLTISTNSNQFSLYQNGQDNSIVGTINTGNANQVAVAQVGNTNTASFVQSGGGNNLGISQ